MWVKKGRKEREKGDKSRKRGKGEEGKGGKGGKGGESLGKGKDSTFLYKLLPVKLNSAPNAFFCSLENIHPNTS